MTTLPIVDAFDHFVVPVDDLVAAEEFYVAVLGGRISFGGPRSRYGLTVDHRTRGVVPHTFITIAGKRVGVYLQTEQRPFNHAIRGAPTYSFEATAAGLQESLEELQRWGAEFDGPLKNDTEFAAESLYFNDPAGNHYCIYVPETPKANRSSSERITGVGYLELEAPDLEASLGYYKEVLGLELLHDGRNTRATLRHAVFRLPSGQSLILTNAPFSPKGLTLSRLIPGPHVAFYVPRKRWDNVLAHLDTLGIQHGDRGGEWKDRKGGEIGTYMDDPAGNVVQFITDNT